MTAEQQRLIEAGRREKHWRRWGPYLSERAWGTVREDYSPDGTAWDFFPFEHAHTRAYRWGEDGLLGICDNHQRLCFALALWNGQDPILKERLFGLSGTEGSHGEDVKELYYYQDSTPTHSYMKALYKYPQRAFPYQELVAGGRLPRSEPELELEATGAFEQNRYFDVSIEYAKNDPEDLAIRVTVTNRGPQTAPLHLLPTVWFRNSWSWGHAVDHPRLRQHAPGRILILEPTLGRYELQFEGDPRLVFTENETNVEHLWGAYHGPRFYKDAFHRLVIEGRESAVNPDLFGTKAAGWYRFQLNPGESRTVHLRLCALRESDPTPGPAAVLDARRVEADRFYDAFVNPALGPDARAVQRQAFAGLLWTKQFYHYEVEQWLQGDPAGPAPPAVRTHGRNAEWRHLFNDDIISVPDKWEYPWYAAWDLAFHMIPFALVDPEFAKNQLALFLREWYMHPNGQLPAYEWALGDVNPPVHAWACWRVYKIDGKIQGRPDRRFLERVFHKLLMNFTWWVNRKDSSGNNIFEGGFLGLDNIGVFDRSKPLPTGGIIEQSDGTSWMAMYCLNMLKIALELAIENPVYEDIASKFFEHFLYIASAMNRGGGDGLWDEEDGFYYDRLRLPHGNSVSMKVRSMVGLIPLFACETLDHRTIDRLPGFKRRMEWFIQNRPDLCANLASMTREGVEERRLLSLVGRDRLRRLLARMLDETEFLSPYGIRSLSRIHKHRPYALRTNGDTYSIAYDPAESTTGMFGGNSNWRGPVWFPVNYLIVESLQKLHHYHGDAIQTEFPTGSGQRLHLGAIAAELSRRLSHLFLDDGHGRRPVFHGQDALHGGNVLFYEYFDGDTGRGLGASHQTGWTALVAKMLQQSGE
ncbi:MAG: glucosidase [Acidobacteria bacterium]|nr:glucosidase [Acidobacteriota bacterium]